MPAGRLRRPRRRARVHEPDLDRHRSRVSPEKRLEVARGSRNVDRCLSVLALDGDEHLGRRLAGCGLRGLAPAPASRCNEARVVDEDHLTRLGRLGGTRAEVGEGLVAAGEPDRRSPGDRMLIHDRDRQAEADAHEIADVDERIDGRDRSLLRQPSQEGLRGRSVRRRIDAEGTDSGVVPIASRTAACSNSKARRRSGTLGAFATPVAWTTAATALGKRSMTCDAYLNDRTKASVPQR